MRSSSPRMDLQCVDPHIPIHVKSRLDGGLIANRICGENHFIRYHLRCFLAFALDPQRLRAFTDILLASTAKRIIVEVGACGSHGAERECHAWLELAHHR